METMAAGLIVGSAVSASLQAMDAKWLACSQVHWTVISLAMNGVSCPVLLAIGRPRLSGWLVLRAVLGGVALNAAMAGVTHINLGSANTIMFSMPCFATAMTAVVDGELPSRAEGLRLAAGFAGTCVVVTAGRRVCTPSLRDRAIGYSGSFGFAVLNAAACVVTSRKLKGHKATAVCATQAFVALAVAAALVPVPELQKAIERLVADRRLVLLLGVEVLSFPLSLFLRTAALLLTSNVHVVSLLYAEIPLVLLWDHLFCDAPASPRQLAGVAMIVVGAVVANLWKPSSQASRIAVDERHHLVVVDEAVV